MCPFPYLPPHSIVPQELLSRRKNSQLSFYSLQLVFLCPIYENLSLISHWKNNFWLPKFLWFLVSSYLRISLSCFHFFSPFFLPTTSSQGSCPSLGHNGGFLLWNILLFSVSLFLSVSFSLCFAFSHSHHTLTALLLRWGITMEW